ncbi:MAG: hypothetical protein K2W95_08930 [Candidatus Obscuribacterales bacterium]|nr:hypothetical protein [Candidatus Obscuribacterales bacterium]
MDIEQNPLPLSQPQPPNIRALNVSDAATSEATKLRRTVFDALVQNYPIDGKFSRQEKLAIKRFGIDEQTLRMESQRRRENEQKLVLVSRTISRGCPLTSIQSISFDYMQVRMVDGQIGLLVRPLHQKERTLRLLHSYGALKILRQSIALGTDTYMLLEARQCSDTATACNTTISEGETLAFEPELVNHGLTILSAPSWMGFSFCLAEQAITTRQLLIVHGVGSLLRKMNDIGVLNLLEEQEYFATTSPYSMMAVVALAPNSSA